MAKPNYRHAKKQKEAARKARQDAKQQRRSGPAVEAGTAAEGAGDGVPPGLGTQAAAAVKTGM